MFKRFLVPSFRLIQSRNSSNLLTVSEVDGVRNITMVDGKTRNCLSMSMMENLIQEIKQNENDKSLRVIVLSSSGPVFSAGHNLKELAPEKGYESHKNVFDKCHELITSIVTSPLPVISKIDGLAAGKLKLLTLIDEKLIRNIYSCWFTASCFLRYYGLQPKKQLFYARGEFWNFLQYTRNCNFSSDTSNEVKLHATDRSAHLIRWSITCRTRQQCRVKWRTRRRTYEDHWRNQEQVTRRYLLWQEVLLPAARDGPQRSLSSGCFSYGWQFAASRRPRRHQKLYWKEKTEVVKQVTITST